MTTSLFSLQPVSSTSLLLRPEGADSPTVLSSQRMRMRGESADGQVGSRAQPPVEARARARPGSARPQQSPDPRPTQPATGAATPAVEEGPANAAIEGQPRTRPSHGQEGRRPSEAGGGPNPTEVATNTGHPQHGGPVDSTMRSAGSAANQPRDQPTMGTPRVHPAEVAPGDVMRKYRLRAARNKRIAAWHSR